MRVAVCQLNARDDREANLAAAEVLLEQAAAAGADLALLPEYVDYLGPADRDAEPEPVDGEVGSSSRAIARRARHLGARRLVPRGRPGPEHTWNTSLVFDRAGALAATYRKIHLYDVEIPGRVSYLESATVAPGREAVVVDVEGLRVGLSICYDLRFPELYRQLATDGGADLLVVPAAFMMHTGRDHWEVLLRARAIENQCFVVAAAQTGYHDPGRDLLRAQHGGGPVGDGAHAGAGRDRRVVADISPRNGCPTIRAELPSLANRRLAVAQYMARPCSRRRSRTRSPEPSLWLDGRWSSSVLEHARRRRPDRERAGWLRTTDALADTMTALARRRVDGLLIVRSGLAITGAVAAARRHSKQSAGDYQRSRHQYTVRHPGWASLSDSVSGEIGDD